MNRADLLYEALKDGKPKSRREIFEAAGDHFMTNNAASELRDRGFVVEHTREGRLDVYRLLDGDGGARRELTSAVSVEQSDPPVSRSGCSTFSAPERRWEPADPPGVGASGVAHASDGAGAENDSGDTSAKGRLTASLRGTGTYLPASPEQLSITDALEEAAA